MNRFLVLLFVVSSVIAQERYPVEHYPLTHYHESPRFRESESHPLRIIGYIFHPIGWVLREGITRPLSYFASSSETTRGVMGWREPYDYRQPECFSADDSVPDCRSVLPFNYNSEETGNTAAVSGGSTSIIYPDVNFDYDKSTLSSLGQGQTKRLAQYLMENAGGVTVVLEGHADARGTDDYNQSLAQARAESVRNELIANGVPAERLSTVSFGKGKPVFADDADWAHAVNRRVSVDLKK